MQSEQVNKAQWLTLALLIVQCSALFSWSYCKLNSRVPSVAVKTEKENRDRKKLDAEEQLT